MVDHLTRNAMSPGQHSNALGRLSAALEPSLRRFFQRRVRNSAEIDDLVQEVFLRLVVRGDVDELEHAGGYVFETAASVLADRGRRRAVRHSDAHVPFDPDNCVATTASAEQVLDAREALNRAALALLELPERTRAVFIMRRMEGLRYQAPVVGGLSGSEGAADFATERGQRLTLPLPDGSEVTLNTDSAIDVDFDDERRIVRLLRGQGYFTVTADARRPFIVEAADRVITALGTEFDVRLDPGAVHVLLVTGRVRVGREEGVVQAGSTLEPAIELHPGERLSMTLGMPPRIEHTDADRAASWRQGVIEFQNEPLYRAVAEFNRYATEPLTIGDPRVARLRISGAFRAGDPERFGRVVTELLPVRIVHGQAGRQLVWADQARAPR